MIFLFLIVFSFIKSISSTYSQCNIYNNLTISRYNIHFNEQYYLNNNYLHEDINYYLFFYVLIISNTEVCNNSENIMGLLEPLLQNDTHLEIVKEILVDFFKPNNSYCIDIMTAISDEKNILLEELENKKNSNISEILNIFEEKEKIIESIIKFIKAYPGLMNLLYIFPKFNPDLNNIDKDQLENTFDSIINFLQKHIDLFDIMLKNTTNNDILYKFGIFVAKDKNNFLIELIEILCNANNAKVFVMFAPENSIKSFFQYAERHDNDLQYLYQTCKNNSAVLEMLPKLLSNIYNREYLMEILFSNEILLNDQDLIAIIVSIGFILIEGATNNENVILFLTDIVRGGFRVLLKNHEEIKNILSQKCFNLIQFAILGDFNNTNSKELNRNISNFFGYKFVTDTTKNSNDLLNYHICLDKPPINNYILIKETDQYNIVPAYIISSVDRTLDKYKELYKNSTQFESQYYLTSLCFPQGKNKNQDYYCTDEDYEYIMKYLLSFFTDIKNIDINTIHIKKNQEISDNIHLIKVFFAKLIPLYIILIPFIFNIIIFLCKSKKKDNINQILEDNEKENSDDDNIEQVEEKEEKEQEQEQEDNFVNENHNKDSKWLIILDKYFNFSTNLKELFNFDSENWYNFKGIRYIRGLTGLSIVLTILGQIYLILYNLPMKDYGQFQFYSLITSSYYTLFFIGLRYSPRILFSCSGFTLTYKYLKFLNSEVNNIFKFIFKQFYKYIILVLIILYMRHSYYYLISFLFGIKPITEIFNNNLLMVGESWEFILGLLGVKSFQINKIDSRVKHFLIDFFWMPFNELFFFLFGTILITIGHKFELRFDIFIIALIIILFISKIIIYTIYWNYNDNKIYTTLYYYIFEYGEIMLNPIFNLQYFLIGMFFGLINHSTEIGLIGEIDENEKDEEFQDNKKQIEKKEDITEIKDINEISQADQENNEKLELGTVKDNDNDNDDNEEEKINLNFDENKCLNQINKKNTKLNIDHKDEKWNEIPYLKIPFKFAVWNKTHKMKFFLSFLLIFLASTIILFIVFHYIIFSLNDIKEDNFPNKMNKISLKYIITNYLLNYIYLIDIDIVIFFVQWGFFILSIKQLFIGDFLNHKYWSFFIKFYFSFLLACNSTILYIFYESETVVKLNLFNLLLYFFIDCVLIFTTTVIIYISFEFPLKKIFKDIISKHNFKKEEENENEEENINNQEEKDNNEYNENDNE